MRQPGITVRPIRQLTGTSEFNEVFFDGARTDIGNVVGEPGDGWRIAKATLEFERGVAMLGQQVGFRREFEELVAAARRTGAGADRPHGAGRGRVDLLRRPVPPGGAPRGTGAGPWGLRWLWPRGRGRLGGL